MCPIVSHKNKYVYFPIPKVACSTIRALLAPLEGLEWHHPWERKTPFVRVQKALAQKLPGYFKFAFVRNPWDRLVSCYEDKVVSVRTCENNKAVHNGVFREFEKYKQDFLHMDFPEFVEFVCSVPDEETDWHFRPQYMFVDPRQLDLLGRFESLNRDLNTLRKRVRISRKIPHKMVTERKPYPQYYTPDLIFKVRERYRRDIELFSYEFMAE